MTIFITCLFFTLNAKAAPYVSLLYGLNSYTDEKKDKYDFTLRGKPIKVVMGQRYAHLEFEMFTKFSSSFGDFIHDGTQNKIKQSSKVFGGGMGIYLFPALKLNVGISINSIKESLSTSVTDIQKNDIGTKLGLTDSLLFGPYFGADFNLLTLGIIKFYAAVNYYSYSAVGGKEIEVALGIKIPFGGGSSRSSSFDPLKAMSE